MGVPIFISELARAKINLTLTILGRRDDGYHELESLVTFADVGDVITLTPDVPAGVSVSGPFGSAIVGENLCDRALAAVAAAYPGLRTGRVHIEKHLPVASGIGGGSADAAAVLRALRRLNADRAAEVDWTAIACSLGADVPACLANRPLIMRGIGERIELLDPPPTASFAVLLTPRILVPANKTAAVFRALGAAPLTPSDRGPAHRSPSIETGGNDLELPALAIMPGIATALGALRSTGGSSVRLSGAGPTCFALYPDAEAAMTAAANLRPRYPDWWIEPTTLG